MVCQCARTIIPQSTARSMVWISNAARERKHVLVKKFTCRKTARKGSALKAFLMASVGGNSAAGLSVQEDDATLVSEMKESRHERWGQVVHDYVAATLFRYVQFINREEVVMYGSGIQKIVCKACQIPVDEQLEFWTNVGRDMVEEVLRRKRQTMATSFRSQFESKCCDDGCVFANCRLCELTPSDPSMTFLQSW